MLMIQSISVIAIKHSIAEATIRTPFELKKNVDFNFMHDALSSQVTAELYRLTNAPLAICMQVIAQATFAAVTQSSIITAMTQNTDLLTTTSVRTAWVCHWRGRTVSNGHLPLCVYRFVLHPSDTMKKGLTTRLFEPVYDGHSVGSLRRAVNDFGVAVAELVGLHHRHPGPVSEVNFVFKQADAEGVWDGGTSVDHCFPDKYDIHP